MAPLRTDALLQSTQRYLQALTPLDEDRWREASLLPGTPTCPSCGGWGRTRARRSTAPSATSPGGSSGVAEVEG